MIGPQLRKLLRWAAVIYMVFGPLSTAWHFYEAITRPGFQLTDSTPVMWISMLAGLVFTVVQGGVLLVLLSIDERLKGVGG